MADLTKAPQGEVSDNKILDRISSPKDLKILTPQEIEQLAAEIRQLLIDVTSTNGGHLAPNLGVVELTLAMHRVFDCPRDKIVFDVGHQSYIHKIITGRRKEFATLRQYKGLSGFPKRSESECDAFGAGHSSTSISAALGIAAARDLAGDDYNVIAVIGDGAMTGGMAFEAMNHLGDTQKRMIVILNDNEMSISKNVGAMSTYLYQLRTGDFYKKVKSDLEGWLGRLDYGQDVLSAIDRVKGGVKYLMLPTSIFEHLGLKYFGPVDGHNLTALLEVLELAKKEKGPVLVHVLTTKGKGYKPAEEKPDAFHGTGPFEIATGKKIADPAAPVSYTKVFGSTLLDLAGKDKKIVAITASMSDGTGLTPFREKYPDRFFDVGIAEQHAVTFAAGMASQGAKPFVAVYSTFMQRAYDQLLHDVCLQDLPVRICLDRAGLVGDDGSTHHGVFDFSYLLGLPGMTVMAPKDEDELRHMLKTAASFDKGPIALRYPRGSGLGVDTSDPLHELEVGKAEELKEGSKIVIWAIGTMVDPAVKAAELLKTKGFDAGVVNMRFAKPFDRELLLEHAQKYDLIVTMEEGVISGGVGETLLEYLNEEGIMDEEKSGHLLHVLNLGIRDEFVPHGKKDLLMRDLGLDVKGIAAAIEEKAASCGIVCE